MKETSLEKKLVKPSKKQWLPIIGIHYVNKNRKLENPTILDSYTTLCINAVYQITSTILLGTGTLYAISPFVRGLFKG